MKLSDCKIGMKVGITGAFGKISAIGRILGINHGCCTIDDEKSGEQRQAHHARLRPVE